jgi:hypothetical protein
MNLYVLILEGLEAHFSYVLIPGELAELPFDSRNSLPS